MFWQGILQPNQTREIGNGGHTQFFIMECTKGELLAKFHNRDKAPFFKGVPVNLDFKNVTIENPHSVDIFFKIYCAPVGMTFQEGRTIAAPELVLPTELINIKDNSFIYARGLGGAAGQYTYIQYLNPVDSGVQNIIHSLNLGSATATGIDVRRLNVGLGTLDGHVASVFSGNSDGKTEARYEQNVSAALMPVPNILTYRVSAGETLIHRFTQPIILPPGYGIAAKANTIGSELAFGIECVELEYND